MIPISKFSIQCFITVTQLIRAIQAQNPLHSLDENFQNSLPPQKTSEQGHSAGTDCSGCTDTAERFSEATQLPTSSPSFQFSASDGFEENEFDFHYEDNSNRWNGIDILISAFFLIAAAWLILAIYHSLLILFLLRMQSRGELDVYDENFGTFTIWGGRIKLHLGCILRKYAVELEQEQRLRQQQQYGETSGSDPVLEEQRPVRIMTRVERRSAIEQLLNITVAPSGKENTEKTPNTSSRTISDGSDDNLSHDGDDPVCTICLARMDGEQVFSSSVCSHQFHKGCIMDWLERKQNTECPCCRKGIISDDLVWSMVKAARKEKRKQSHSDHGIWNHMFRRITPTIPSTRQSNNLEQQSNHPDPDEMSIAPNLTESSSGHETDEVIDHDEEDSDSINHI